ncbi:hypothetical protein E2562_027590 [Oryza meyeriana var. granulata]|uniref:Uncharacterized protein n=1 Tax=Oryza meyeriana var. granulata TaxID=110450 RepID=A0A6G1DPN7_9ORYZ|nr:hypothetical protein E2562_027590 [Oryza meyeriana var. granulata]
MEATDPDGRTVSAHLAWLPAAVPGAGEGIWPASEIVVATVEHSQLMLRARSTRSRWRVRQAGIEAVQSGQGCRRAMDVRCQERRLNLECSTTRRSRPRMPSTCLSSATVSSPHAAILGEES